MAAITGIYIDGFKSFAPVEGEPKPAAEQFASLKPGEPQVLTGWYPIKPLTVLAGANSSGKSTFLQALLLLKQTYDSPSDPGPLKLSGPNAEFDHGNQLVHKAPRLTQPVAPDGIGLGISLAGFGSIRSEFEIARSGEIALRSSTMTSAKAEPSSGMLLEPSIDVDWESMVIGNVQRSDRERIEAGLAAFKREGFRFQVRPVRAFMEIALGAEDSSLASQIVVQSVVSPSAQVARRLLRDLFLVPLQSGPTSAALRENVGQTLHVPGTIAVGLRRYPNSVTHDNEYPGQFTDYHARILADWTVKSDPNLAAIEGWLFLLGLASKLVAHVAGGAYVEIFVGRTLERPKSKKNDLVNIADVGVGLAQVLPILVALAAATEHNTLVIQQPELHLHPRAQAQLAEIICGVIKEKRCTVLIETHSDVFLRRLRSVIAEGELPANDAVFHWFKRDEKSGATTVTTVIPDEQGRSGEWPVDFADVQLEEQKRYIKATQLHTVGRKAA